MALACGEELADGALCGLGRVRGADEAAEILHGVIFKQHHGHDGAGGHELDKLLEERAILMHGIELCRLVESQAGCLDGRYGVAGLLNFGKDVTNVLVADSTGLNHRKGFIAAHIRTCLLISCFTPLGQEAESAHCASPSLPLQI